ncbi:MAG TPA: family 43 glycosylhydrolase [Bacteroidaceae bacterium]|jgi:hypothetical protein|nr:family 43 glycosylhydrolase [Bacteroidaceae bacterium]HQL26389.1 family 43 glycosylhydrolase [Bacteroidaceae bacterium]
MKARILTLAVVALVSSTLWAQNPIIRDQFTADPSALVVGDRVYVFPSHDIKAPAEYARKDWFCMADYHVFSSDNLTDWTDHGMIVDQWSAPWVNEAGYSMWAPDCKQNPNNGKYYFFFPAGAKTQPGQRFGGNRVGVCISDYPEGPYKPEATPLEGVGGIDPCIFVDDDGQGYLVMPGITITKLNDDWLSISTDPADRHRVEEVPTRGLVEGPYLFKRNGKYYMTFPWAREVEEVLAYCMADNIFGPYKFMGVFFEEHESKCWTNHHSIIDFKGQTYLFYHNNMYSPEFDKNRAACADSLFFEPDGTIRMVKPTLRGIGVTDSKSKIQLDRYTALSGIGDSIAYLEPSNYFAGWKTVFYEKGAWAKYNTVNFAKAPKKVTVKIVPPSAGTLEILQNDNVIATVDVPADRQVITASAKVSGAKKGIHHLKVRMATEGLIQVDWLTFE